MITENVTATLSTKNRFHTTLPLVLTSLANQTLKPSRVIIYDDNDTLEDLRENEIYKNLFLLLNKAGINWEITVGERRGQIFNHQRALQDAKTEWIWRLDDDNIMEPNTLQDLYNRATSDDKIGAVGPLILDPKNDIKHPLASNKIEDIFLGLNIQWRDTNIASVIEVDHLQGSTFLFRKAAAEHGYDLKLSKVGHREETIFTYEMKRKGWKLLVDTSIKTWHMRYGAGGIRSHTNAELFKQDEDIFLEYFKKWKVTPTKVKVIPLDSGIGDHYAFRGALPDIKKKYKGYKLVLGACYPEVFIDETDVQVISLAECSGLVNVGEYNIYAWMDAQNWKKTLTEAYREAYA